MRDVNTNAKIGLASSQPPTSALISTVNPFRPAPPRDVDLEVRAALLRFPSYFFTFHQRVWSRSYIIRARTPRACCNPPLAAQSIAFAFHPSILTPSITSCHSVWHGHLNAFRRHVKHTTLTSIALTARLRFPPGHHVRRARQHPIDSIRDAG